VQRIIALTASRHFHRVSFSRRLLPLSKVITRDIVASLCWLKNA
jgi:hypothetical protein